jgi:hypothetical protein
VDGSFYECGVFAGGIAQLLAHIIGLAGSAHELHLFNSFEGLPQHDPTIDYHKLGEFKMDEQPVRARLQGYHDVFIHKGWIPSSFEGRESDRIAFVHLDLDLYRSTLDALDFVLPRMIPGGIIVLDDFGSSNCRGVDRAVTEALHDRPEPCLVSAKLQGVIRIAS